MDENYVVTLGPHESLLEIIDDGINGIILQIKKKLGTDIYETNKNAAAIMNKLNDLKNAINIPVYELKSANETRVKLKDNDIDNTLLDIKVGNEYVKDFTDSEYIGNTFEAFRDKNNGYLASARKEIQDLDTDTRIDVSSDPSTIPIKEGSPSSEAIQTRLNNCHILEMLYLIKHEEVMKTFAFTLNLFDKYKYSIKLLLFVLKFLVKKKKIEDDNEKHAANDQSEKPCVDVKLPKTLIPNIQTLLADQEKVQEVITGMKQQLETNPLGGVEGAQVLNPADGPNETDLNADLSNSTTP